MTTELFTGTKSKYWYISSAGLGDIGLESDEAITIDECIESYRKQADDWEEIAVYPTNRYELYLTEVDIMSYEYELDWHNRY